MKKGFTLLELIIVIIIIGILATLGFTQYGNMVEKGRGAEARSTLGYMRKLAYAYRLANGSVIGMTNNDINCGTAPDQFPNPCRSSHYFYYGVYLPASDPTPTLFAYRCASGGKEPQNTTPGPPRILLNTNLATGKDIVGIRVQDRIINYKLFTYLIHSATNPDACHRGIRMC